MKRLPRKTTVSRPRRRQSASPASGSVQVGALLQRSLEDRWAVFVRQVGRAKRRCTEPAIHDLRVATRRLIAMLDVAAPLFADDRIRTVRRRLKKLLKSFNDLRDLHIQRISLRGVIREYPVLRYYRSALIATERRLVREGSRRVATYAVDTLSREIAAIQSEIQSIVAVPGMIAAGDWLVRGSAAAAYRRAVRCRWEVVPSDIRSLHKLRVAFKKLRYTLEVLQPLIPWARPETLKAMNGYQTAMGEIQDAEVFLVGVREFARSATVALPNSWLPVTQELARRRTVKIQQFLKHADDLYAFWRSDT